MITVTDFITKHVPYESADVPMFHRKMSGNGRVGMKNEDDGRLKEFEVVPTLRSGNILMRFES